MESSAPISTQADALHEMVQLTIQCRNLKNLDVLSKSDPVCKVFEQDPKTKKWNMLGQTERINNNLNPDFKKTFDLKYFFERHQQLKFQVVDDDGNNKFDDIGSFETTLGKILGSRGQTLTGTITLKNLQDKKGQIMIHAESIPSVDIPESNLFANIHLKGENMWNRGPGCLCFPGPVLPVLYEITRSYKDNDKVFTTVCTSIVDRKNTRNPAWKPVSAKMSALCSMDETLPLKINIYMMLDGQRIPIGETKTSVQDLRAGKTMELEHGQKLIVNSFQVGPAPTFLDYLREWQISLSIAVDFTLSNGRPKYGDSLHCEGSDNQYEQAIIGVGSILEPYDYDRKFPTYGFGGDFNGRTSHCFPLNGNRKNPEVSTIEGVMVTYRESLEKYDLSAPTYFADILKTFIDDAQGCDKKKVYQVLLILTDGMIGDMAETKRLIVESSELPTSIIIVGVGNANFNMMEELDGDDGVLTDYLGNQAQRDIVQFVAFNQANKKGNLSEQVLGEIPRQLCNYMRNTGQTVLSAPKNQQQLAVQIEESKENRV